MDKLIPHMKNYGLKNFHCIMGGKIDNVYDVIEQLNTLEIN